MASLPKVALIGATGSLGSVVLSKILAAGFPVTILTRQGSSSTASLPAHQNQTIKEVDYSSKDSLTTALTGTDVAISTIATSNIGDQIKLIDAARATGTITRFIPSEFGSDIHHPNNINLPVFAGKIAIAKHLEELAELDPKFTYTNIQNNAFLDWGLSAGSLVSVPNHSGTLWDGGDNEISVTTLGTVGNAVVAVLNNLDSTANKTIKIRDTVVTQNQLIAMVKKVDGKEWNTTVKDLNDAGAEAWTEFKDGNTGKAMFGFLMQAIWGDARVAYTEEVNNEALGLQEMSAEEVEEVVRKVVQG